METLVKLNSTRAGRDKMFRAVQYGARFINATRGEAENLKDLEKHLSQARKLLRLGTFLDSLYGLRRTTKYKDTVIALTTSLSRLCQAMFLYYDALLWLNARRLYTGALKPQQITQKFQRWWLGMVCMNLARDWYELRKVLRQREISNDNSNLVMSNKPLFLHLLIHCCDFVLPATGLGYLPLAPAGLVGLCGVVSSLGGLAVVAEPQLKLSPPP